MSSENRMAIILAAGVGSRLRPLTDKVPKCLVRVNGESILAHQLSALQHAGVDDIVVVAGYRAAQVRAAVGDAARVIENKEYAVTNNMYSLSLGLSSSAGETIILNGDVVFDPEIVRHLLGCSHTDAIAVDVNSYLEESMKVTVADDGTIRHISKTITKRDAHGCSIDMYRFSRPCVETLQNIIEKYLSTGDVKQWTEVAIDKMLGIHPVYPFDIGVRRWVEIDNFDDLHQAEELWTRSIF